jgi:hypothetical protein
MGDCVGEYDVAGLFIRKPHLSCDSGGAFMHLCPLRSRAQARARARCCLGSGRGVRARCAGARLHAAHDVRATSPAPAPATESSPHCAGGQSIGDVEMGGDMGMPAGRPADLSRQLHSCNVLFRRFCRNHESETKKGAGSGSPYLHPSPYLQLILCQHGP